MVHQKNYALFLSSRHFFIIQKLISPHTPQSLASRQSSILFFVLTDSLVPIAPSHMKQIFFDDNAVSGFR